MKSKNKVSILKEEIANKLILASFEQLLSNLEISFLFRNGRCFSNFLLFI